MGQQASGTSRPAHETIEQALGWLRRRLNQATLDLAAAAILGGAGVLLLLIPRAWGLGRASGPGFEPVDAIGLALALLQTVPIVSRRRAPMAVLATVGGATIASGALGFSTWLGGPAVLIAVYSVAAHTDRRTSTTALAATTVGLGLALLLSTSPEAGLDTWIGNMILYGSAWLIGDNRRVRRAYTRELEARAARLQRDREAEAARAVADERSRIARELHDVVMHSVTVMTVQASAARQVLSTSPDDTEAALQAIESTGRDALAEMRRLLGVLRTDDGGPDLRPQPSLDRINELVAQINDAGLPAHLEIEGESRPLPSGVDLAAYRIVQEALTNSLKHAGRATATVRLRYGQEALDVQVVDDGRGAAAALAPKAAADRGPGHGLIGMRERVGLYGGRLEAGPRIGGGYAVRATVPIGRAQ